jgi:glycosyltransferase involved in cell wall biosynthesis
MFSVIIPLYNKGLYIQRAIGSVLKQTFSQFEIIVVDDGSTDNGVDSVKNLSDKRIKLFCKENGGVSSARNFGIGKASCEFIAFLDADDEWLDDYLESLKKLIQKYPDCGMYASGRYEDVNGQRSIMISKTHKDPDFIFPDYCKEHYILQMSSLCIKRAIINKVGLFNPKFENRKSGLVEDIDFKLRVACYYEIAYLNLPKTVYYVGMENNSFSKKINLNLFFHLATWYFYPYKNKWSLYIYTTKRTLEMLMRAYLPNLYKKRMLNYYKKNRNRTSTN